LVGRLGLSAAGEKEFSKTNQRVCKNNCSSYSISTLFLRFSRLPPRWESLQKSLGRKTKVNCFDPCSKGKQAQRGESARSQAQPSRGAIALTPAPRGSRRSGVSLRARRRSPPAARPPGGGWGGEGKIWLSSLRSAGARVSRASSPSSSLSPFSHAPVYLAREGAALSAL